MSVPKNRRKKSRFEVFHNMAELQKLLVKDLMVDFGITRMTNLGEAQFLDIKFERIVNLSTLNERFFNVKNILACSVLLQAFLIERSH